MLGYFSNCLFRSQSNNSLGWQFFLKGREVAGTRPVWAREYGSFLRKLGNWVGDKDKKAHSRFEIGPRKGIISYYPPQPISRIKLNPN